MKSLIEEKRCCACCGQELEGRSDKKFCDDVCRNNYAYRKRSNDLINRINKSLVYNRNVLKSMMGAGRKTVKKQILLDRDFDFNMVTGIYITRKRHEYRLLYDYAYRYINDDEVLIVKWR